MPLPTYNAEKVPVTCTQCNKVFFRSKKSHSAKRCKDCSKVRPTGDVVPRKLNIETVLPKKASARFCKIRSDWYMNVRTRKRGSGEELKRDKVYLWVGADATPEQVQVAYAATYARLGMQGASTKPDLGKQGRKKLKALSHEKRDWEDGPDRGLGITRMRVYRVMFAVHLADPKTDGKKVYVGRFSTLEEARAERKKKYRELQWQLVPCAVCGELPSVSNHRVVHLSSTCPNRVQMPYKVRPLFQTKLWNFQFSTGKIPHAGRLSLEDLHQMGFLWKKVTTGEYGAIPTVEFDTRSRKPIRKDEVFFE